MATSCNGQFYLADIMRTVSTAVPKYLGYREFTSFHASIIITLQVSRPLRSLAELDDHREGKAVSGKLFDLLREEPKTTDAT